MIDLPFNSEEFIDVWNDWIEYKHLEFKFKYKSPQSMRASLKKLNRLSGGNEQKAIAIVEESMANGWKGFFALKDEPMNKKENSADIILKQYGLNN